jgi:hypothetical protein
MSESSPPSPSAENPSKAPVAADRRGWLEIFCGGLLLTLLLFVPWRGDFAPNLLDASWGMVLHWSFLRGLQFGKEIVFQYGPWGFLVWGYLPGTFAWVCGAWAFLSVAFFLGCWQLARQLTERWWIAGLWLGSVILIAGMQFNVDTRLFLLGALLLLNHFYVDDRAATPANLLLAVAAALASLVKFTMLLLMVPVVLIIAADDLRRRRFPTLLAVYSVALLLLWLGAGQHLSTIGPFLHNSAQIAAGYRRGAAVWSSSEGEFSLLFFSCGLLVCLTIALADAGFRQIDRTAKALILAGFILILLMVFQAGTIQHDQVHEAIATSSLALIALMCGGALWSGFGNRMPRVLALTSALGSVCLGANTYLHGDGPLLWPYNLQRVTDIPGNVGIALDWAAGTSPAGNDRYQKVMQAFGDEPLPDVQGSVDIYPWGQSLPLARHLDYHPRPVFQSYLACMPELEKLNADFLAGPSAADNVLFSADTKGPYPSEQDALSWPELLTRYEPANAEEKWLLLRRSAAPRGFTLSPLQVAQAPLGQWLNLPSSDDPIWVSLDVPRTTAGKLVVAAYKLPTLLLGVATQNGRLRIYRLIPDTAPSGFLLSPEILGQMPFALLYSPDWRDQLRDFQVTRISIAVEGSGKSSFFDKQYTARFFRLQFPHSDVSAVPGIDRYLRLRQVSRQARVLNSDSGPRLQLDDDGRMVLSAATPNQTLIPVPSSAHMLHLTFAVSQNSFMGPTGVAAVQFLAAVLGDDVSAKSVATPIWSQVVRPVGVDQNEKLQNADIPLPTPAPKFILLMTTASPANHIAEAWWVDINFR